jgi:hypothetical protein
MKQNFINQITEPKPKQNERLSEEEILNHLFDDDVPQQGPSRTLQKEAEKVNIHFSHCL